jgi:hypothetical protein
MANVNFRITNLGALEASLNAGLKDYANDLMDVIGKELQSFRSQVIRRITTHEDYVRLRSDDRLRGQLGLAKNTFKVGGDTDQEDLRRELDKSTITMARGGGSIRVQLRFPTLAELADRLIHSFTRIIGGVPQAGPTVSWFGWWEFGNTGDYEGATIFIQQPGRTKKGKPISKDKINKLIQDNSRSGQAIQLVGFAPNARSVVPAHKVVYNTYENFGRVLPARVGVIMRRFTASKNINTYFRNT